MYTNIYPLTKIQEKYKEWKGTEKRNDPPLGIGRTWPKKSLGMDQWIRKKKANNLSISKWSVG